MQNNPPIDERQASWKVLLPAKCGRKVLAIGVSEEVLCGLSRSFGCVDSLPIAGKMYDSVVLDCNRVPFSHFHEFRSCIDRETIILCLNPDLAIKISLKSQGYSYDNHYAGLPAAKPRIYFPLITSKLRAKGLSFHSPGRWKVKIALSAAKILSRLGIKRHLMGNSVSIFSARENTLTASGLAGWISEKVGYNISDLVVYAGSESQRRKITVLAIAEATGNDVVVKIADSSKGAEAIRQESAALNALSSTPLSLQVPELLFEDDWNGYIIQAQRAFSSSGSSQDSRLTDAHFIFLAELASIDRKFLPFRNTHVFKALDRTLKNIPSDSLPPVVANTWYTFLKKNCYDWDVLCHRTHGDFAPWNICTQKGKLFVYDWEDSLQEGLSVTDGLHFVFRQADLVGPWPGSVRMLEKFRNVCARYFSGIGCVERESYEKYLLAWLVKEYAENRSDRIVKIIDHVVSGCNDE